jgi:hypothetical protein
MSSAGEKHRNSGGLCCRNNLFISHTSTRLDDSCNACINQNLKAICEWEKSITCRN